MGNSAVATATARIGAVNARESPVVVLKPLLGHMNTRPVVWRETPHGSSLICRTMGQKGSLNVAYRKITGGLCLADSQRDACESMVTRSGRRTERQDLHNKEVPMKRLTGVLAVAIGAVLLSSQ